MNETPREAEGAETTDLLYKEYVRLSESCNAYIRGALSDIKLLGAVGAVLAWDPMARMLDLNVRLDEPVTPVGFTTLLLVIMFVLFYNLLKQSIFFFHQARMRRFETRLNALYPGPEPVFALALAWPDWQRRVHDRVAFPTFGIFYLILIGFPTTLMLLQGFVPWAVFYAVLAVLLALGHMLTVLFLIRCLERDAQDTPSAC
ncbi:hypothetical protein TVNIR_2222 [Thioalkalivibrio nitratireducens DSM 14787]|uniref:Transmembrane protein n=1 Tax=Thioalkalivibrio nitratireducens (strain DSM 14787 / UNIQEM 213 / ALEN2) TaxID=1255043 RepID=L0DXX4_THIND|nr:hypothetical protein [Thioalkalivibrio nitratireducens]AGA33878.1 hypothetical protein TVNIR_2222 [Thioalkalivibrio nitratireducens DSM 14787]